MAVNLSEAALLPEPEPARDPARAEALVEPYRRLAQVFHHVLSEQSLDSLLDRIADTLADLVPHDSLTVYQADERRRQLIPVLARDRYAEEILSTRHAFGEGITGWAVEHRRPVLSNQAHLDPRVKIIPGTPPDDPESLICVPLIARGSLKGALNVYRIGVDAAFGEDEFELAKWFGDAAALALDNAQIRARLEHLAQTDSLTGLYNHRYFHERLRAELTRASRAHDTVALLLLDIDDFKRVNDICGHGEGDQVLLLLAEVLRSTARASDTVCRVGGEEFAVILPSCDDRDAVGLATRLNEKLGSRPAESVGEITLSVGIALGPKHAMNGRELIACAEAAMMTAKAQGKNRVVVFEDSPGERPEEPSSERDVRSIAHLKMLQSLARKLNRLNDVREIGEAIVDELRILIDYHNCVVYLADGRELVPVAVRGDVGLDAERDHSRLRLELGEGVTGYVAETGRPLLVANALECEQCVQIPGTKPIDESLISVPLRYGQRVIGAISLSKLGIGQFDGDDLRLLEVLAGHASIALENARLYESLRRQAENAKAWLEFADAVSEAGSVEAIGEETVRRIAGLMEVEQCSLWLEDHHAGNYRCVASVGYVGDPESEPLLGLRASRAAAAGLLDGRKTPFVIEGPALYRHFVFDGESVTLRPAAVAPLHPGYGVKGWITVRAPGGELAHFTDERLRLLEGLSFRASAAIQKATLFQAQQESAEIAGALLEFARQLAAVEGQDEALARIVELAARMLGSPRGSLWLETGRPGEFRIAAAWREDGGPPVVPIGTPVDFGHSRRLLERSEPLILEPGGLGEVPGIPPQDVPFAIAPLALPGGRLGCIGIAVRDGLPERKLRLLAGIAHQASIALGVHA